MSKLTFKEKLAKYREPGMPLDARQLLSGTTVSVGHCGAFFGSSCLKLAFGPWRTEMDKVKSANI